MREYKKVRLKKFWEGYDGFNWYTLTELDLEAYIQSLEMEIDDKEMTNYHQGEALKAQDQEIQGFKNKLSEMKEHFTWITDRLENRYGENPKVDYMIKARKLLGCRYVAEGASCSLNNNCKYPNCDEKNHELSN